jgi:hypothetical protein
MSLMYTALVMASVARWSGRATISSGCSTSRQFFMPIRTLFQTTGSVRRLLAFVTRGRLHRATFGHSARTIRIISPSRATFIKNGNCTRKD